MAKKQAKGTIGIGRLVAVGLALAIAVAGVLCCGYASRTDEGWFKNGNLSTWHWSDKPAGDEGNVVITEGGSNKVQLRSAAIALADYAAYGISEEETETAYTLTIKKKPEDSVTTKFTWGAEFVNAESSWATGKSVSDYITVTPAEDNLSAVVACKQAFGEQIEVKVVYDSDPTIFATRRADYVKRVVKATVNSSTNLDFSNDTTGEYFLYPIIEYGTGTVQGNFQILSGYTELSDEAYNYLMSADSSAHNNMSQFLAANNNNISVKTKTTAQQYDPERSDWFDSDLTTSFLDGYNYKTTKNINYYNAAFKEMLENTANQIRTVLTFKYTYETRTETITAYSAWESVSPSNIVILNDIDLNGNELIF